MAVLVTPEGHSDRATMLTDLGARLSNRYSRSGNADGLEAAILRAELAVSIAPEDYHDKGTILNNLDGMLAG